jgi:uncharacterized protein YjbI with pentapeptide repeats
LHARIVRCTLAFADLSYARIDGATIAGCDFTDANLHAVDQQRAIWHTCTMLRTRGTDRDRLYAETWKPPE